MPKRKSSRANSDSDSDNDSCDNSAEVSETLTSESESSDEESNAGSENQKESDDERDDVPLINWRQIPPNEPIDFSRFPFTGKPGITVPLDRKWSELDYVKLFLDNEIVDLIVTQTNYFAEQHIASKYATTAEKKKYGWYPLTSDEFWAFFAILIYQSIISKPKQRWYWTRNKMFSTPFANSIMSLNRFEKIMKFLHFSNNENYNASEHPCPQLHKVWEVYKAVNSNFQKIYVPERDISIDESLMPSKHHLSFLQFIPSKRARFGVKFFVMCESNSGYILKTIAYTGNSTERNKEVENCCVTTSIVLELSKNLLGQGYCLIMDNFYNSPELYEILLSNNTDAYGTLNRKRKGLPALLKSKTKMKKDEALCWTRDDMVCMKWHDKKDVTLISTCHDVSFQEVTPKHGPTKLKPTIVLDYNKTMGGVDRSDQQMGSYTVMRKQQKKYYKKIFRHLLDQCLFNAFVLYKKYKSDQCEHLSFLTRLIIKIKEEHATNLTKTLNRGSKRIEKSLYGDTTPERLTGRHFPKLIPSSEKKSNPTRRCKVCFSKKVNDKPVRKETRYYCRECDAGLCAAPCFEIYHSREKY